MRHFAWVLCLLMAFPAFAGPSKPSGGGFSGGSPKPSSIKPSSGGFSSGNTQKPSSIKIDPAKPKQSSGGFSGNSNQKPSGGSKPAESSGGFSGGNNPPKKTVTSAPIPGKTPVQVSKKPAANDFNTLAAVDSKKAESRRNYEQAHEPAKTYKTPKGNEIKIDPKDKEISYLRGRLDGERWASRPARVETFYSSYYGRSSLYPPMIYADCYHPMWNYSLLSYDIGVVAMWMYCHPTMDPLRQNYLYSQNAQLQERVRALELQQVRRDPTYMPPGVEVDVAYNEPYANAAFNPKPRMVDEYEYEEHEVHAHHHSEGWSGFWKVMRWLFYITLAIAALGLLFYLIFVHRW